MAVIRYMNWVLKNHLRTKCVPTPGLFEINLLIDTINKTTIFAVYN